ncbi:carboxypeptidase-like regulatory domain-containing protein [Winogradskyella immobilis]|uniref:Carboxypeptidase-like protein n=1 Tax=Winogradskyella immobilis TaxID=2816852 RepID=A0ABS8EQ30_9FLAO|nr:carboxypeptidase-like regulatory domain-containing protein [Winogradskyella immobilis]MCC1484991.1 hypothetical protein [Winogradskyella immobilis]MCG0017083.1 carboxypeptidase-like regulatory domain-containing protein [Winogradskyella immobilis]
MSLNTTILKKYILALSFLFGLSLSAQTTPLSIKVIESETKDPIPYVTLVSNNEIIGYTNGNGIFLIKETLQIPNKITFIQNGYKSKTVDSIKLKDKPIVLLERKPYELEEVLLVASKPIYIKEILKNSVKAFENNFKEDPYLTKTNFKQFLNFNDSLSSFIEIDGDMILLGKNKDVWSHPVLIPKQVRRTKENLATGNNEKDISHLGMILFSNAFKGIFRFFELRHPLSKKGNKLFNFQLEEVTTINNEDCYVINYYSKEDNIKIIGRDFNSINGQIIVKKKNFNIVKTTALFRRGQELSSEGWDVIFKIDYNTIEEFIYYKKIAYGIDHSYSNKNTIYQKGLLTFSDVNTRFDIDNNFFSNRNLFIASEKLNQYNNDYWKDKPLLCCGFMPHIESLFSSNDTNSFFSKGSKQTVNLSIKEEETIIKEKQILDLINSQ